MIRRTSIRVLKRDTDIRIPSGAWAFAISALAAVVVLVALFVVARDYRLSARWKSGSLELAPPSSR